MARAGRIALRTVAANRAPVQMSLPFDMATPAEEALLERLVAEETAA